MMNRVFWACLCYIGAMFLIALTSEELMSVQIRTMRARWGMLYFIVPILVFAGRDFDLKEMMRRLFPYIIIMSIFYIIDGFILNGWVMLPYGMQGDQSIHSTFSNLVCTPFSFVFPRIFAEGLYIMALAVLPVALYYRLPLWQWIVMGVASLASRTVTVMAGLVATYVIFRGHGRKLLLYVVIGMMSIPVVYLIDKGTGGFMRVQSTIDQFLTLGEGMDEDDMANFASGRGAQVIPKLEALYDQDREWLGFGFLHPELTKKAKFIIDNDLYIDVEKAQEVVTEVEVAPVQTVLDMGYIGFAVQLLFFFGLYYMIRKLPYSKYYLSVLVCIFIFGVSGYSGLNTPGGLIMIGFALGCVLLADKQAQRKEGGQACTL